MNVYCKRSDQGKLKEIILMCPVSHLLPECFFLVEQMCYGSAFRRHACKIFAVKREICPKTIKSSCW